LGLIDVARDERSDYDYYHNEANDVPTAHNSHIVTARLYRFGNMVMTKIGLHPKKMKS